MQPSEHVKCGLIISSIDHNVMRAHWEEPNESIWLLFNMHAGQALKLISHMFSKEFNNTSAVTG